MVREQIPKHFVQLGALAVVGSLLTGCNKSELYPDAFSDPQTIWLFLIFILIIIHAYRSYYHDRAILRTLEKIRTETEKLR